MFPVTFVSAEHSFRICNGAFRREYLLVHMIIFELFRCPKASSPSFTQTKPREIPLETDE